MERYKRKYLILKIIVVQMLDKREKLYESNGILVIHDSPKVEPGFFIEIEREKVNIFFCKLGPFQTFKRVCLMF